MDYLYLSDGYKKHITDKTELVSECESALKLFLWQLTDKYKLCDSLSQSTYKIMTLGEYKSLYPELELNGRSVFNRYYIIMTDKQLENELKNFSNVEYTWSWKYYDNSPAYEVTSRGDRRYSPFFQKIIYHNRLISLEDYYKKVIKPQKEAGTYVEGTGHELMTNYLKAHKGLIYELLIIGKHLPFSDMFDKFGGQNRWYAEILNSLKHLP